MTYLTDMTTPIEDRFLRNKRFDTEFDKIVPKVTWYPYVGPDFDSSKNRVMVFAHNIPIGPESFEARVEKWKAKDTWASALGEYTYCQERYTRAFRFFVIGSIGLTEQYGENPDAETNDKIEALIKPISYINFIQGLVRGERPTQAKGERDQIESSKEINKQFLRILGITHCICWGKHVYNYLLETNGYRVVVEKPLRSTGFANAIVQTDLGNSVRILKIFHPSMPGFRPYSKDTPAIISEFLSTPTA